MSKTNPFRECVVDGALLREVPEEAEDEEAEEEEEEENEEERKGEEEEEAIRSEHYPAPERPQRISGRECATTLKWREGAHRKLVGCFLLVRQIVHEVPVGA